MSYGLESYGFGSYGGSDFIVDAHIPSDNAIDVNRLPTVGFVLLSDSGDIVLASINLTINGIQLILNGVFTINATGSIDNTNPAAVQITANTLHEFGPLELVVVVVDALNTSSQSPINNTWQFTINNEIRTFTTYIVRGFERIFRVAS